MDGRDGADDALLDDLREMWSEADPVPHGLADRMIAAVAVEDASCDLRVMQLIEEADREAVRSGSGPHTLRFGDEQATVLLHIAATKSGYRIDAWSDPPVVTARLQQDGGEYAADANAAGRFSFSEVAGGRSLVRMAVRGDDEIRAITTPWFEV